MKEASSDAVVHLYILCTHLSVASTELAAHSDISRHCSCGAHDAMAGHVALHGVTM